MVNRVGGSDPMALAYDSCYASCRGYGYQLLPGVFLLWVRSQLTVYAVIIGTLNAEIVFRHCVMPPLRRPRLMISLFSAFT